MMALGLPQRHDHGFKGDAVTRQAVAEAKRLVVKVGSSSLASPSGGLDGDRVDALVDALGARLADGAQVVLVSSGAIAAGLKPLGPTSTSRPTTRAP